MTTQEHIIEILGGAKVLGVKRGRATTSLQELVRAGLRFSALEAIQ